MGACLGESFRNGVQPSGGTTGEGGRYLVVLCTFRVRQRELEKGCSCGRKGAAAVASVVLGRCVLVWSCPAWTARLESPGVEGDAVKCLLPGPCCVRAPSASPPRRCEESFSRLLGAQLLTVFRFRALSIFALPSSSFCFGWVSARCPALQAMGVCVGWEERQATQASVCCRPAVRCSRFWALLTRRVGVDAAAVSQCHRQLVGACLVCGFCCM